MWGIILMMVMVGIILLLHCVGWHYEAKRKRKIAAEIIDEKIRMMQTEDEARTVTYPKYKLADTRELPLIELEQIELEGQWENQWGRYNRWIDLLAPYYEEDDFSPFGDEVEP